MSDTRTRSRQADDGAFILEAFVPFKLAVLSETLSKLIARDYSDRFGITMAEWRVLALVGQYDEVRAQTVVDKTPMDKVAVSRAVAALVEKGLIEKRTSETDRRSAFLHLSGEGERIAGQILAVALSHNDDVLAVLDEGERRTLHAILDKLIARVAALSDEADLTRK